MAQELQGDGSRAAAQGDRLSAATAGFAGRTGGNGAHAPAEADAGPSAQQQPSPSSSNSSSNSISSGSGRNGSGSGIEPCPWDDYTPPGGGLDGHPDSLAEPASVEPANGSRPSSQHGTGQVQGNGSAPPNGSHSREGSQTRMIFADQALSSGR
jgi:hypothetical protein